MKSESIGKLAEALAKAQGEMENAAKDKDNPFFKSSYADLASVWDACREPLSKNGLAVTQSLNVLEGRTVLTSLLMHSSGEWISSEMPIVPVKNDPQGIGSAITYFRRFALSALVGVAAAEVDDDGNAASDKSISKPVVKPAIASVVVKPTARDRLAKAIKLPHVDSESVQSYMKTQFKKGSSKDLTEQECVGLADWIENHDWIPDADESVSIWDQSQDPSPMDLK